MPTWAALRHAAQNALDDGLVSYALAGATSFTVGVAAIASIESNLSPARYNASWLYHVPGSGAYYQSRLVGRDSYNPITAFVAVNPAMAVASTLDLIELTSKLPVAPGPFAGDASYLSLANIALSKMLIPGRVALPITTAHGYEVPSWLRTERLIRVREPVPMGGFTVDCSWRRPHIVASPNSTSNFLTLDEPFIDANGSIGLDVLRPANTLIATAAGGGVFVESTVGLNLDSDQVNVDTQEWLEIFLAEAYRALANRDDSALWTPRWEAQDKIARAQPHYDDGHVAERVAA